MILTDLTNLNSLERTYPATRVNLVWNKPATLRQALYPFNNGRVGQGSWFSPSLKRWNSSEHGWWWNTQHEGTWHHWTVLWKQVEWSTVCYMHFTTIIQMSKKYVINVICAGLTNSTHGSMHQGCLLRPLSHQLLSCPRLFFLICPSMREHLVTLLRRSIPDNCCIRTPACTLSWSPECRGWWFLGQRKSRTCTFQRSLEFFQTNFSDAITLAS